MQQKEAEAVNYDAIPIENSLQLSVHQLFRAFSLLPLFSLSRFHQLISDTQLISRFPPQQLLAGACYRPTQQQQQYYGSYLG